CLYFDQEATAGEMILHHETGMDENLLTVSARKKRFIRNNKFGMVYQNPIYGLKMDYSAISNVAEKMIAAGNRNVREMEEKGNELLQKVNIPSFRVKTAREHFQVGMRKGVQLEKTYPNHQTF